MAEAKAVDNELASLFQKAAQSIASADRLLITSGAGFSADSGLAVYKDIADVPAYRARNLTYRDICEPDWLDSHPDLFYGFWGSCFNDYRDVKPHDGYQILLAWCQSLFTAQTDGAVYARQAKALFPGPCISLHQKNCDIRPCLPFNSISRRR